jgi:hypothetical protein
VACPTATQCTAVNNDAQQVTFDPANPGTPTPTTIDTSNGLDGVACPSATQCTAVDGIGQQVTFDPASPGTPTPTPIDAVLRLAGVACPSATQCTAIDITGHQVTFDPASPGTPTPTSIDPNSHLTAIACVSADECTAVDETGHETTARAVSTTSLACTPTSVKTGIAITCTATVTDTQTSGASPTGTTSFTASPNTGQFSNSGSCPLHAAATTGIASCQITFIPSAAASYTLTANYTGDNAHLASSGQSTPITATPPPVTVKPPPTASGRASVKHISTSDATVSVRVNCKGSTSCKIKLTGTVLETIRHGKVIALAASTKTKGKGKGKGKRTSKKTITIISKTATIPAGKTKTIKLTLNAAGKKLIAKHHPLKAKLAVTQSSKTVTHQTITLKPKPKPKKKRKG